jgi:protein-S-isoprenylcysteine O-methyltransferase Ste14
MKPETTFWFRSLGALAFMAAIIFLAAGRFDYWQGWVFLGLTAASLLTTIVTLRNNPGLVSERTRPGGRMKWWDKGYYMLSTPLWFAAIIVASLDAGRNQWSGELPGILLLSAIVAYAAGQGLYLWAKAVNPFFSSVARIQAERGQTVCREGPYRFCRHPGYLGGILFGLATPLALGSYWAFIPQAAAVILLLLRTFLEDRMLKKDLLWYEEYAKTVRFRLVPGLW